MLGKRRSALDVMADILRVSGHQTDIMYRANLSYAQTKKYLHTLTEEGLLEMVNTKGRPRYRSTDKGRTVLELVAILGDLVRTPARCL